MSKKFLQLHPKDNILAALQNMEQGYIVNFEGEAFPLRTQIAAKHKFALRDFNVGDPVLMYGALIGKAIRPIVQGETITTENVVHASADYKVGAIRANWSAPE